MWHIWIDTGGSFTDCVAVDPAGTLHRAKVLSHSALRGRVTARSGACSLRTDLGPLLDFDLASGLDLHTLGAERETARVVRYEPHAGELVLDRALPASLVAGAPFEIASPEPAGILAARLVTRTPLAQPLPPARLRFATTRGTNALLERRGAPVALFMTRGFGDLLAIGDQQRPDLFALAVHKPPLLYTAVVEVPERIAADGTILAPLDLDAIDAEIERVRAIGIDCAAVALLHAWVNPAHEERLAARLRERGFAFVSAAAALAPLMRLVPRAETAVVDAYLGPIVAAHLDELSAGAAERDLQVHVMTSAGGLVASGAYRARDSVLSGPAAGLVGAVAAARRAGHDCVITFDMGGTSTDVARFAGDLEYRFEHRVAGVRLVRPALAIETVAAGGGSMCHYSRGRLSVGPQSAGAVPGPACYGAGGPLTLTDVNLLLGRLDASRFEIPIVPDAAERALGALIDAIGRETHAAPPRDELLDGLLDIANALMAGAIAQVSVARGYDPRDHVLVAFGGAGGQHACAIAERLGIDRILMPADASLLSAAGLGAAAVERFAEEQVLRPLGSFALGELEARFEALAHSALREVERDEPGARASVRRRIASVRARGQDATLDIEVVPGTDLGVHLIEAFAAAYRQRYGYDPPTELEIEVESIRVVAWATWATCAPPPTVAPSALAPAHRAVASGRARASFAGSRRDVATYERGALAPGAFLDGPALVLEQRTCLVIEPGWRATVNRDGSLDVVRDCARQNSGAPVAAPLARPEIVRAELFANRMTSIAREMGELLERTAISTNVRERLDFSCAVLDPNGELIVNAPHIPVHLGALGLCVRSVRERLTLVEGDVAVTNHPAFGGSHLPDVTVISPVFAGGRLVGYVANRAHHAEIGGTRPGSMPPGAKCLAEEGILIAPRLVVAAGESREGEIEALLRAGPWPSRAVRDNLADLRAQVAANRLGERALARLAESWGPDETAERMTDLADRAERLGREAIAQLFASATLRAAGGAGEIAYEAATALDDGTPLAVHISFDRDRGRAIIDFAGSGSVHVGSFNATPAIVASAVMFVLRLVAGREELGGILNEGLMRAVEIRVARNSLLDPVFTFDARTSPAVVAGNVETSQRIVEVLLRALGLCAGSQGTMNNVLFGNGSFGYYETVCGGCGAGPGFEGASAVHSHMTNTRITDCEVLEHRYPVRLERFAIRAGSGGAGRFRGGDGVVRDYRFLAPMSLSIVSQHRAEGGFGAAGGSPGAPGGQRIIREGGLIVPLRAVDGCEVGPGDRLQLETPGGGGWGAP